MIKFAVIDIETTGGNSSNGKITEISIFLYDGNEIIDEFTTLVNPERFIPPFITRLTGITDAMVAKAPTFPEIAKRIIEITHDAIFVAHNVSFDYNFVKGEFASLGYDYERKTLCTIVASRKLIPGHKSYGLGNICADLGIEITDRHRARGDAAATVTLLQLCLSKGLDINLKEAKPLTAKERRYSTLFDPTLLTNIPTQSGVYYFYNNDKELIYIGKSKNLKQRIPLHFIQTNNSKGGKIKDATTSFDYALTGSELIALLMESEEIKYNKPALNKIQRKTKGRIGLFSFFRGEVYSLTIRPIDNKSMPLTTFDTMVEGKKWLESFCNYHQLCASFCAEEFNDKPCFNYQVRRCNGVCAGNQTADDYNIQVQQAIDTLGFFAPNVIVFDHGRRVSELAFLIIEQNNFVGYGWIDKEDVTANVEELKEHLYSTKPNADAKAIINGFMKKNKVVKILHF